MAVIKQERKSLTPYILFSIRPILYQIWIAYINFKTFEEYVSEQECAQSYIRTNGRTDKQTYWMHKHFFFLCFKVLIKYYSYKVNFRIHFIKELLQANGLNEKEVNSDAWK